MLCLLIFIDCKYLIQTKHKPFDNECLKAYPEGTGTFTITGGCRMIPREGDIIFHIITCNETHAIVKGSCQDAWCSICHSEEVVPLNKCIKTGLMNVKFTCGNLPTIEEDGIITNYHPNPDCTSPTAGSGAFLERGICFNSDDNSKIQKNLFVLEDSNAKSSKVFFDKTTNLFYDQKFSKNNCKGEKIKEEIHQIGECFDAPNGPLPYQKYSTN
eukprot:gene4089-7378_t